MTPLVIKRACFAVAEQMGVNAACRWLLRDNLLVLCYHGVISTDRSRQRLVYGNTVSQREFHSHLDYLASRFHPISAADLIAYVKGKAALPRNAVLVTFDDGYRNNLTLAALVLAEKGIPAVFHLTTEYLGTNRILWPVEIQLRVLDWPYATIESPVGTFAVPAEKESPERHRLADQIAQLCKRITVAERDTFLGQLRAKTPPKPSHYDAETQDFLSWEEARKLAGQGFEIGSHTCSHPILTGLTSVELEDELRRSKHTLEANLGGRCAVLAYPNGSAKDWSSTVVEATRRAGYEVAFAVEDRPVGKTPDAFAIPRLGVAGHVPVAIFCSKVSGLYSVLGRS